MRAIYCVASESCAFDLIGARYLRDVAPGEVVTLGADGLRSRIVAGDSGTRSASSSTSTSRGRTH